ncbi:putative reverse transcriptase domain-containing protein [Tanacetum coccineum]
MAEGEIDNLIMEQYLALTRGNQAPGVVKPEIGGNESSIPGISLKRPLSKGTVHHQELPNNLRKSATSSMKETRHFTKLGNDLGVSVNVIPKSMFEHLKLDRIKKTDMLVEMADVTKRSPIRIVKNVLVKIDKFLFPSDFVVMDMLNTRNETMILGRPFLATIHAEIDVFNKEISLGIRGDRVTFDMNKKIHNFTTHIGEIYMINATSNTPSDASSRVEETNDVYNKTILVIKSMDEVVGHTNIGEPVKKTLLKSWLIDCFRDDVIKDLRVRSFDDYKWMKVQGDNTYWWHDQKLEEEKRQKLGINIEEYEPPMVHIETFEVKRYSFDTGQSFIYVTKELMDALSMGRENGSRFRDMIHQLSILAKDKGFGQEIHKNEESKAVYGVTPLRDYAVTYSNEEMSHHTLYSVKCLQDYAATLKITKDDVSDSALRRNMGDKVMLGMWDFRENIIVSLVVKWLGNMMNEVDIENLTIEQYVMLTQESQTQGMVRTEFGRIITKDIKDMTITEYTEYEAEIKKNPRGYAKSYTRNLGSTNLRESKILENKHQPDKLKTNDYFPSIPPCFKPDIHEPLEKDPNDCQ